MSAGEEPLPTPQRGSRTIVVSIDGEFAGTDGPALCTRVRHVLEASGVDVAIIDVTELTEPELGAVDALARVLLTARRLGRDVRFRHASRELQKLLALVGLEGVVPLCRGSGLEAGGKAEEREQARRVKE